MRVSNFGLRLAVVGAVAAVVVLSAGTVDAQQRIIYATVDSHTPDPFPPTASNLEVCFNVTLSNENGAIGGEYVDRFDIDLPDTWTVDSVTNVPPTPGNLCLSAMPPVATEEGVEAGNVVYWQNTNPIPSTCGPYQAGSYSFCVNVSYAAWDGPHNFPWVTTGDDSLGAAPGMDASGTYGPVVPVELLGFSVE